MTILLQCNGCRDTAQYEHQRTDDNALSKANHTSLLSMSAIAMQF